MRIYGPFNTIGGKLYLPQQGTGGGIKIGGDVDLYRGAANILYIGSTDQIHVPAGGKIRFRDADLFINSANDGHLDIDADTSIDLNALVVMGGNDLVNAIINKCKVSTDARVTPQEGDLRWDATAHKLQIYNGTAWETVTSA